MVTRKILALEFGVRVPTGQLDFEYWYNFVSNEASNPWSIQRHYKADKRRNLPQIVTLISFYPFPFSFQPSNKLETLFLEAFQSLLLFRFK